MAAVRSEKPASNSLDDEDEENDDMSGVELRKLLSDSVEDEQVTEFDSMKLSDLLESQETDIANTLR